MSSIFFSGVPADLAGRFAVNFLEHPAEKLVVGKAVFVQDLQHRFVRRTDVVVDVCQSHVVYMLREGNTDILPEHAAEIVTVEAENIGNLLEGERLHIVLVNVRADLLDPELIAAGFREIFLVSRY